MQHDSRVWTHTRWVWRYVELATGLWLASFLASLALQGLQATLHPVSPASTHVVVPGTSMLGYLTHNVSIAVSEWLGSITGLIPLYVLWENGISLATYVLATLHATGLTQARRLLFLIPHGLLEIPAILLVTGASLYIMHTGLERLLGNTKTGVLDAYARTLPVLGVALILFTIAALVESQVSPAFAAALAPYGAPVALGILALAVLAGVFVWHDLIRYGLEGLR